MEENKGIEIVNEKEGSFYRRQQKILKNRQIGITMIAVLVAVGFFLVFWNRSFNSYKEVSHRELSEGTATSFINFNDGYLKYSKDGITYLDYKEKTVWTEAYTMTKPYMSVCETTAVLADLDGNTVHLYDLDGRAGAFSMAYPIKNVIAAKDGVFCMILDGGDVHYIQLYNSKGTLLAEIKTQIENNGYPLSVDISSDGEKLAASFYRVDGIESKCVVSFYNFGEGGKGQSGNLVGTYQFDDLLIPKVEFMDDETVYAVGDSETLIYQMKNKPKLLNTISFSSEIQSIFSNEKYYGYVCINTDEDHQDGREDRYQVYLYNKKGRLVRSFGKNELHENIKIVGDVIVGYSLDQCTIEQLDGKQIFSESFGGNIRDVLSTDKRRDFLVVFGESSSRIRLRNDLSLLIKE